MEETKTNKAGERTQFPYNNKLAKGDHVTNWHGEIRHRYAGLLATYEDRTAAAIVLDRCGFRLTDESQYTGGQTWEIVWK